MSSNSGRRVLKLRAECLSGPAYTLGGSAVQKLAYYLNLKYVISAVVPKCEGGEEGE